MARFPIEMAGLAFLTENVKGGVCFWRSSSASTWIMSVEVQRIVCSDILQTKANDLSRVQHMKVVVQGEQGSQKRPK